MTSATGLRADLRGGSVVPYVLVVGLCALASLGAFRAFGQSVRKVAECQGDAVAELRAQPCAPAKDGDAAGRDARRRSTEQPEAAAPLELRRIKPIEPWKPPERLKGQHEREPEGGDVWKDPWFRPKRYPNRRFVKYGEPLPDYEAEEKKRREGIDEQDKKYREWVEERYKARVPPMRVIDDTGGGKVALIVFAETHTPSDHPDFFKDFLPKLKEKYPDIDTLFVEAEEGKQPEYDEFVRTGDASKIKDPRTNSGGDARVLEAARKANLRIVCVDANDTGNSFDTKRDERMTKNIQDAFDSKQTKKGVFIVGAAHVRGETAIPPRLQGISHKVYRASSGFWAGMFGWEFGNPPLNDEFAPDRSAFKLNVDPGAWGFTTRGTKTPAPHLEHGQTWDFYDGYIHVGR